MTSTEQTVQESTVQLRYRGADAKMIADEVQEELRKQGVGEAGSFAPLPDEGRLGSASQIIIGLVMGAAGKAALGAIVNVLESRLRQLAKKPRIRVTLVSPSGEPLGSHSLDGMRATADVVADFLGVLRAFLDKV
jgi:hypothetical protein